MEVIPKKIFMISVGENLLVKLHKNLTLFRHVWENSGKNLSHPQKMPDPTPMGFAIFT